MSNDYYYLTTSELTSIIYETYKVQISITGIAFCLPNIVILVYKLIERGSSSTLYSFIHSILLNLFYTFLLYDLMLCQRMLLGSIITLVLVIANFGLNIMFLFYCQDLDCAYDCNLFLEAKRVCRIDNEAEHFYYVIDEDRSMPPTVKIEVKASHEESREVWSESERGTRTTWQEDQYGNRSNFSTSSYETHIATHYSKWGRTEDGGGFFRSIPGDPTNFYKKSVEKRTVTEWTNTYTVNFQTWEDQTLPFKVPHNALTYVFIDPKYVASDKDRTFMAETERAVRNEGYKHDSHVVVNTKYDVPGLIKIGYMGSKYGCFSCMMSFGGTFFSKILFGILFLMGYSFFYESLFNFKFEVEHVNITKYISRDNNLRAKWGERDRDFVNFDFV